MSIDFSTKEGRKKYLTEKLDDLIEGINESYGSKLVEELLDRLEFTIEEFNDQMLELHKNLVDKEKERRQMLDMINDDTSFNASNPQPNLIDSTNSDTQISPENLDTPEPEPELTEWEIRLKDVNGQKDTDKDK